MTCVHGKLSDDVLCVPLIAGIAIALLDQTIEPYARGLRNLDALAYDRSLPRVVQFRLDLRLLIDRRFVARRLPRVALLAFFPWSQRRDNFYLDGNSVTSQAPDLR